MSKMPVHEYHRFLDEAGDTTFYRKGRVPCIGEEGVSNVFILGMIAFKQPLDEIRNEIRQLQTKIETSAYYRNVPSVQKRISKGGYFFHAKDDLPEIKKEFFDYINTLDCRFQAVVARKTVGLFERKHNGKESEFYADLLSHLLKDKFSKHSRLVLNIAERSNSTAIQNLTTGLKKAESRFEKKFPNKDRRTKVSFNVQKFKDEPLLTIADYLCWAVQRVFERGETRFYDYVSDKISLVVDLYDTKNYEKGRNYYKKGNPLTEKNKVSPHSP